MCVLALATRRNSRFLLRDMIKPTHPEIQLISYTPGPPQPGR